MGKGEAVSLISIPHLHVPAEPPLSLGSSPNFPRFSTYPANLAPQSDHSLAPYQEGQISYDALDARLDAIDAVMREHSLLLDVVEHPRMLPPSGGGGGPVRWTLHMDGDLLVGRGEAAHDGEVLCSALFARLRNEVLRHTPCYSGTWDD